MHNSSPEEQGMKISVIGVPWYAEENYDILRRQFVDGDKLHRTYKEWLTAAQNFEQSASRNGGNIIFVEIEPEEFAIWCKQRSRLPDARSRATYASEVAKDLYLLELQFEEAFEKASDEVLRRFRAINQVVSQYVVPVFTFDKHDNPEFEGSGILVKLGNAKYLATAAHVIHACKSGIYLPAIDDKDLPLQGYAKTTVPRTGEKEDKLDIGFVRLTKEESERLEPDRCFHISNTIDSPPTEEVVMLTAIGYPVRDQRVDIRRRSITTAITTFMTGFVEEKGYRMAKVDPNTHILVRYQRRDIILNETRGAPPNFKGMSGGGVWPVFLREEYSLDSPPPLAGMIIERPSGYGPSILATRASLIRELIQVADR